MNLILKKEYYQDKVDLDKYINVKIIKINNFMQLNYFKKKKDIQILMKYKQYKIFNKIIILLIIMIFIIDKLKLNKMEFNKNVQLLKWKQEYNHQKINY